MARHASNPQDAGHAPGPREALASDDELLSRYASTRDMSAREELVRRYLPFARSLALRYRGGSEPAEDLIQVANLALINAIERFEPERGIPFTAFAAPTILGELKRHFRDRVWTLRVPRGLQERIADVEREITKLTSELERPPTVTEIAERLGIEDADVLEVFEAMHTRRTLSLDQPMASAGEAEEVTVSERVGEVDSELQSTEERETIKEAMSVLSDRERLVLRLRFVEDLTQSQIADQVGFSQMHVSRILRRALARLREAVGEGSDAQT